MEAGMPRRVPVAVTDDATSLLDDYLTIDQCSNPVKQRVGAFIAGRCIVLHGTHISDVK